MATTFGTKFGLRIGTWNVLTLAQPGKLAQLSKEADRLKIEVLGLSEVRWLNNGEQRTADGQSLLFSGPQGMNATHERGVGFLLSRKARAALLKWEPINERIIVARFRSRVRNVSVVQAYAPTEQADIEEKERFYSELEATINRIPKGDIKILMGDYNAKIGCMNTDRERIMGRHGLGERNENGELFTEFCGNNDLIIGGSLFPHKTGHKVTWVSHDGKTENQIDHICISRKWRRSLLDVRNKRSADIASDHHLLIAVVRLRIARVQHSGKKMNRRFDVKKLTDPGVRTRFVDELTNKATTIRTDGTVEEQWTDIKNAFIQASEKELGHAQSGRKPWLRNDTWEKIEERRAAKISIDRAKTRGAKQQAKLRWHDLSRTVKRMCRRDKRMFAESIADEAETAAANGNLRMLYEKARLLTNSHTNTRIPLRNARGQLITDPTDQLKIWFEHFSRVLQVPNTNEAEADFPEPQVRRIGRVSSSAPSVNEIEKAIRTMKNGKAPGMDLLSAEMLKADSILSARLLHGLFSKIWETEQFPYDWMDGILVKVPKKGDKSVCDSWRGIMLLCHSLKVLCKVLLNRLEDKVDATLRRQQAGFRASRSCIDHIATLRIIMEQINEMHESLYLLFIDFEKAFDRLQHDYIWEALRRKGIPDKLINLIKAMYDGFMCRVLHAGNLSDPLQPNAGVRQGCILSPLLFLIVIDELLSASIDSQPRRGILWHPIQMEHLEDLDYADDLAFMSTRHKDMQDKIDDVSARSRSAGLKINVGKTKSMAINPGRPVEFTVDGNPIECVTAFPYLGSNIAPDGGARDDVDLRITKARAAFASLNKIWRSSQLTRSTKLRIFNSNVKSVLLYGCETWLVSRVICRKLQTFVNRCLRRILRIWWPNNWISNDDLWKKCNQKPIYIEIRERKWGWIGHTLRKDPNEICREALDWNPQGTRRRGRPRGSWRRSLEAEMNAADDRLTWLRVKGMAGDRRRWKSFTTALCAHEAR